MSNKPLFRTPNAMRRLTARIVGLVIDHGAKGLSETTVGRTIFYPMGESMRVARNRVSPKPLPRQVDFTELAEVRRQLCRVASDDTAYKNEYDRDICPLHNHCGAVAFVVQQKFGGLVVYGKVNGVSHYWNLLPCGTEVDLTGSQFGGDGVHPVGQSTHILPLQPDLSKVNPRFLALQQRVEALIYSERKNKL